MSSLKETFLDALDTSDMHSNNLNFYPPKKGMVLVKRENGFFPERGDLPTLEGTVTTGLWYGLIIYLLFEIKFCIKICKKTPSSFFISYNCFTLVFTSNQQISFFTTFQNFFIQNYHKKDFCHKFSFFNNRFTQFLYPPITQEQPKSAKICVMIFFVDAP